MPGNAAVKSTARVALRAFWLQAIACGLILIASITVVFYATVVNDSVFGRYSLFINLPFMLVMLIIAILPLLFGVFRYFYRATEGVTDNIQSVFHFFAGRRYLNCIRFSLMLGIKLAFIGLVTYLPNLLIAVAKYLQLRVFSENFVFYVGIFDVLFGIIGTVLFVLATSKYYIAPMIYVCCPDMHWTEVFYMSKHISRQTTGSFLVLLLGFIGWFAASLLGIPMIFTLPYFLAAYAVHCRYAFHHYNKRINILKETEFPEFRSSF